MISEFENFMARQRRKAMIKTMMAEMLALFVGTGLLVSQYGWKTGIGLGLLAYVAMPIKQ